MRSQEPITTSMTHKYIGLKENPVILIERKILKTQDTKKIKQILQNSWLLGGHTFVSHKERCSIYQ